jgi:hypothetical protein
MSYQKWFCCKCNYYACESVVKIKHVMRVGLKLRPSSLKLWLPARIDNIQSAEQTSSMSPPNGLSGTVPSEFQPPTHSPPVRFSISASCGRAGDYRTSRAQDSSSGHSVSSRLAWFFFGILPFTTKSFLIWHKWNSFWDFISLYTIRFLRP